MLSVVGIVLHPFILILMGFWLSKKNFFSRPFWDGVEKLVYFVLFPPLLFNSVATANLGLGSASRFLISGLTAMGLAVVMAYLVSKMAKVDRMTDAAIRQCGYRFNSYIGFALASSLYGTDGLALFALLLGLWVPISNAFAVTDLSQAAQKKGEGWTSVVKAIATNPLILATVAGLIFNVFSWTVPSLVFNVFKSLGSSSLALALLAIGSGMAINDLSRYKKLLTLATVERLVAVPLVAVVMGLLLNLSTVEMGALLCFTALPTANSCYILATRMGGNGEAVADLTTLQTLVAVLTLPLWMMLAQTFV